MSPRKLEIDHVAVQRELGLELDPAVGDVSSNLARPHAAAVDLPELANATSRSPPIVSSTTSEFTVAASIDPTPGQSTSCPRRYA